MNLRSPDAPQPGTRPEGAALRFLRWLIEPPVGPQPGGLGVVRWLLRASVFVVYAMFVGPSDGTGNAGVGPKRGKSG